MRFMRKLLLALGISCISTVSAKVYSNVHSVSEFITQLDLSQEAESRVAKILDDYDVNSISNLAPNEKASLACQVNRVANDGTFYTSTPPSAGYLDVIRSYWSNTCWLEPMCIIEPSSAAEVSKVIQIVTFTGVKFSIRSGGHNPNSGWANNDGGILIDMVNVNDAILNSNGSYISVGPGNRWQNVYELLNQSNTSAVGGRVTNVGVGGYLLGGGLSHFSSQYGLAATKVRNFEVVLSNSSIINANANTNLDLYSALKGGGANFGIVTKYDIDTVDNSQVWYEGLIYDPSQSRALLSALVDYAGAAEHDEKASLTFILTGDLAEVTFIYNSPVERPNVFGMFYRIPSVSHVFNSTIASWNDAYAAIAVLSPITPARRMITAVSYEFDNSTLQDSYSTFQNLSAQAKAEFNGTMAFVIQPFTRSAVQKASMNGGNPLGLTEVTQAWVSYSIEWPASDKDDAVLSITQTFEKRLESIAKGRGKHLPYRFMNDAGFNQNVLASYGQDSLSKMRSISHSYDPYEVFQELQNDGFLLAKA